VVFDLCASLVSRLLKASFQAAHKITTDLSQITDPHRQKHRSLRSLKNNLSAGSPLDSCPQVHPLTSVRRFTPLTSCPQAHPLTSCPQAHPSTPVRRLTLCLPVRRLFLSEALFFPLWRSEFRRNRGWLVRRARACSQARTDVAYTEVVDLRPPSAVFFLFCQPASLPPPCTRRHPRCRCPLRGEGSCPAAFFSEELESSPPGGS